MPRLTGALQEEDSDELIIEIVAAPKGKGKATIQSVFKNEDDYCVYGKENRRSNKAIGLAQGFVYGIKYFKLTRCYHQTDSDY